MAAMEHYTAVMGDFALNNTWDDHHADPALSGLFRWHGSEEVEHRCVAHGVATYFRDGYPDRLRALMLVAPMIAVFIQRGAWYLIKNDPDADIGWWHMQWLRYQDSKKGLLPRIRTVFGTTTLTYFRPGFNPREVGSTAQAVAYLAASPAARASRF